MNYEPILRSLIHLSATRSNYTDDQFRNQPSSREHRITMLSESYIQTMGEKYGTQYHSGDVYDWNGADFAMTQQDLMEFAMEIEANLREKIKGEFMEVIDRILE